MAQHTWEIQTTAGLDYLFLEDEDDIEKMFELYKNSEDGEYLKITNAELISYRKIN